MALTRRAGAELAEAGGPRDKTLVRHVYDLHAVRAHYDPAAVIALAREIMLADVEAYGHQFPAYRENPVAETLRAVAGLAAMIALPALCGVSAGHGLWRGTGFQDGPCHGFGFGRWFKAVARPLNIGLSAYNGQHHDVPRRVSGCALPHIFPGSLFSTLRFLPITISKPGFSR